MREMAGSEDYGAPLGDAAATTVVEVDKREARAWGSHPAGSIQAGFFCHWPGSWGLAGAAHL
jgi:hypothetical protein